MVSGLAASARVGVGVMLVVVMAVPLLQPACVVQASKISISCSARDDQGILKTSLSRVTDELALRVVVLPPHARRQGRRGFYPQQWATVVPGTSGKCGASSVSRAKSYFQNRGMDYLHDMHDWLGGYPYETASADDVDQRLRDLGFFPERVFATRPRIGLFNSGCDEYVYRR